MWTHLYLWRPGPLEFLKQFPHPTPDSCKGSLSSIWNFEKNFLMNEWSWSHLALWFIPSVFLNSDICFLILIQGYLSMLLIVILNTYFQVKLLLDIQPFASHTQLRKMSGSPRLLSFLETVIPVPSGGRPCSDLVLCHHLASLSQLLSWIRWSHLLVSSIWQLVIGLNLASCPCPGLLAQGCAVPTACLVLIVSGFYIYRFTVTEFGWFTQSLLEKC